MEKFTTDLFKRTVAIHIDKSFHVSENCTVNNIIQGFMNENYILNSYENTNIIPDMTLTAIKKEIGHKLCIKFETYQNVDYAIIYNYKTLKNDEWISQEKEAEEKILKILLSSLFLSCYASQK